MRRSLFDPVDWKCG